MQIVATPPLPRPHGPRLIAIADQGRVAAGGTTLDGPSQTLPALYGLPSSDFHDITSGGNGTYSARPGYDEVTGLGSPVANLLVPGLATFGLPTQLAVTAQPPASVTAGSGFGLTVPVEDSSGNVITNYNGSVTIALATNPGGSMPGRHADRDGGQWRGHLLRLDLEQGGDRLHAQRPAAAI